MSKTTYVVLRGDPDDGQWGMVANVEATSAEAAIRAEAGGDAWYVAVPLRSWHPMQAKIEKVERVKLGRL